MSSCTGGYFQYIFSSARFFEKLPNIFNWLITVTYVLLLVFSPLNFKFQILKKKTIRLKNAILIGASMVFDKQISDVHLKKRHIKTRRTSDKKKTLFHLNKETPHRHQPKKFLAEIRFNDCSYVFFFSFFRQISFQFLYPFLHLSNFKFIESFNFDVFRCVRFRYVFVIVLNWSAQTKFLTTLHLFLDKLDSVSDALHFFAACSAILVLRLFEEKKK